jgi:hypothetical protein
MAELGTEGHDRAVARLALGYALRAVHRAAAMIESDILDGVIRIAIADANIRHMSDNPELAWSYNALDRPVPDEMRHPVSINAIAMSLNLPFETTRRRVAGLVKRGICTQGPRGVLATAAGLSSPRSLEIIVENFEDLRTLRLALRAVAPDLALEPPGAAATAAKTHADDEPYRAAGRAAMAFMLRFIEPVHELTGDLLDGIILLTIGHANALHVATDPALAARYASNETPIPDEELKAIPVQALARILNLSFETTRRRVRAMEAAQLVARRADGVYIPASVGASSAMQRVRSSTAGHLQRIYTGLWRLGVRFD